MVWRRVVQGLSGLALLLGLAAFPPACSLGNVSADSCTSNDECVTLYGLGSVCSDGYCGEAAVCKTDVGCRALFGYGAVCTAGACLGTPHDARCTLTEPANLIDALDDPVGDYHLIGGIFRLQTPKERARADAARLAVREINEQGGLLGKTLGLVLCDNEADADGTSSAATVELARYLGVGLGAQAIIGPSSSSGTTGTVDSFIDERTPTLVISPSATSSSITKLVDRFDPENDPFGLLWRTCASDALQGKALAQYVDGQGLHKLLIIFQRDTYGQGLEETLRIEMQALEGQNSVASVPFELDEKDLASALNAATAVNNVEAIVVISNDAARTLRVFNEMTNHPTLLTPALFLTDGSKDQTVLLDATQPQAVIDLITKAQGTAPATPTTPAYQTFATNLKSQFGTDPEGFSFVANAYDATYAAAYALLFGLDREARPDGFDLAEGMSRLISGETVPVGPTGFTSGVAEIVGTQKRIDLEGTSGHLSFDPSTGDTPADIEVWKVSADFMGFDLVTTVPF